MRSCLIWGQTATRSAWLGTIAVLINSLTCAAYSDYILAPVRAGDLLLSKIGPMHGSNQTFRVTGGPLCVEYLSAICVSMS